MKININDVWIRKVVDVSQAAFGGHEAYKAFVAVIEKEKLNDFQKACGFQFEKEKLDIIHDPDKHTDVVAWFQGTPEDGELGFLLLATYKDQDAVLVVVDPNIYNQRAYAALLMNIYA